MNDLIKPAPQRGHRIEQPDDHPKMGEWFWVTVDEHAGWEDSGSNNPKEKTKKVTHLLCATHVGSNYVEFDSDYTNGYRIPNRELLARIKREPNWREIISGWIEERKLELQETVKLLADKLNTAGLLENGQAPATLLPSVIRADPKEQKTRLLNLKNKSLPAAQKHLQRLTEEITQFQKSLYLAERSQMEYLKKACGDADGRIFALEMYAGLVETVKEISTGEAAPGNTPIAIRQMLRYMDEECLFDLDEGGMDFSKLADFHKWLVRPVNRDRLLPEPRCVVAFKVRRKHKKYPPPSDIMGWFALEDKMRDDARTFLYMRNGERIYALESDVDFEPALLPTRTEFHKPLVDPNAWMHGSKHSEDDDEKDDKGVTPDSVYYDEALAQRKKEMTDYNRVMFLIQGLLDRSEIFSPHPPINLGNDDSLAQWIIQIRDEEDGLPNANPPNWEELRDKLNAKLKPGHYVYVMELEEKRTHYSSTYGHSRNESINRRGRSVNDEPRICEVTRIDKAKTKVRCSWSWGTRWGYQYGHYGKYGEWPVEKKCHAWHLISEVFNITDYELGTYKPFLCDANLKGKYLQWAPALLGAEKWHREKK